MITKLIVHQLENKAMSCLILILMINCVEWSHWLNKGERGSRGGKLENEVMPLNFQGPCPPYAPVPLNNWRRLCCMLWASFLKFLFVGFKEILENLVCSASCLGWKWKTLSSNMFLLCSVCMYRLQGCAVVELCWTRF